MDYVFTSYYLELFPILLPVIENEWMNGWNRAVIVYYNCFVYKWAVDNFNKLDFMLKLESLSWLYNFDHIAYSYRW